MGEVLVRNLIWNGVKSIGAIPQRFLFCDERVKSLNKGIKFIERKYLNAKILYFCTHLFSRNIKHDMNLDTKYPAIPDHVPPDLTQPPYAFRSQVRMVIATLLVFVCTYLLMVALAVLLAWGCIQAGLFVMVQRLGFMTLLIGGGIKLMGALVYFFLIKFHFATSGGTQNPGVQIEESDEPQLFEFIRRVADEVGTHFPKKVFLTPEVNASVFYSSSFWSLFIPTRKNLNIGLGLVNAVNVSEFKAVLAHEFGHFSQKSMRLGSYVYYVNQVIFNMLYHNNGWAATANVIAGVHVILTFFVQLAVYIVQGVQWVLRGMYSIVNRRYLGLSRAMEFHADTISASVSGSNNMAQALRQIELGDTTFQQVVQRCNTLLATNQAPRNCYVGQQAEAAHFAATHKLPFHEGVPLLTRDFMERQQYARVNFKNQWASHPTREEREDNLQALNLTAPVVQDAAWNVFQHPEKWQQQLTAFMYRSIDLKTDNLEDNAFVEWIREDQDKRKLPGIYEGYFDGHSIYTEKWADTALTTQAAALAPAELKQLFEENLDEKIASLQNDVNMLVAIMEGRVDTKTFDFDGKKYSADQAEDIKQALEKEITQTEEERSRRDTQAASVFLALALHRGPTQAAALKAAYDILHEVSALRTALLHSGAPALMTINMLASNNFNLATEMVSPFRELYQVQEPQLRALFMGKQDIGLFPEDLGDRIRAVFMSDPIQYHLNNQPIQEPLETLYSLVVDTAQFLNEKAFEKQKLVLVMQEELLVATGERS